MSVLPKLFLSCLLLLAAECAIKDVKDEQFEAQLEARNKGKLKDTEKQGGNLTEISTKKFAILVPEKELESVIYFNTKLSKKMLMSSPMSGISRTIMGFEKKDSGEQLQTFYEIFSYLYAEELTDEYVKELKKFVVESFQQTNIDYMILDFDGMSTLYKKP